MKKRIKDTLVQEMKNIHGDTHEGWWTDEQALDEVSERVYRTVGNFLEWWGKNPSISTDKYWDRPEDGGTGGAW
jgi:hypothetical protein